jgi:hypothetical protein
VETEPTVAVSIFLVKTECGLQLGAAVFLACLIFCSSAGPKQPREWGTVLNIFFTHRYNLCTYCTREGFGFPFFCFSFSLRFFFEYLNGDEIWRFLLLIANSSTQ